MFGQSDTADKRRHCCYSCCCFYTKARPWCYSVVLLAGDAFRVLPILQLPALRRLSLSGPDLLLSTFEHASPALRENLSRLTALTLRIVLSDSARALGLLLPHLRGIQLLHTQFTHPGLKCCVVPSAADRT